MMLQIFSSGRWVQVSDFVFRSWSGPRMLDGIPYQGPVYVLGSDDLALPLMSQAPDVDPRQLWMDQWWARRQP